MNELVFTDMIDHHWLPHQARAATSSIFYYYSPLKSSATLVTDFSATYPVQAIRVYNLECNLLIEPILTTQSTIVVIVEPLSPTPRSYTQGFEAVCCMFRVSICSLSISISLGRLADEARRPPTTELQYTPLVSRATVRSLHPC